MISVIITAKQEARTIGRAVSCFLKQLDNDCEIIVVAPDKPTLKAAQAASSRVVLVKDKDAGKAAAMNLVMRAARGETLIFSDGDVLVEDRAVKELLAAAGQLVSGRPVPQKSQIQNFKFQNKFDYWQKVLFDTAHKLRLERAGKNGFLLISGYLFAIQKSILADFKFPQDAINEDEYLSYWAYNQGYQLGYAPAAMVKVKYPCNYSDWLKQKTRSLAGGYQIGPQWKKQAMRSFSRESMKAWQMWKSYVNCPTEAYWMALLFLARLHVWLIAWWKFKVLKLGRQSFWQRVESTK